jgi:hypothetical protein
MSKLALLFLLAATPAAAAPQDSRVYAPATAERPGETTILNTSIVKVDGPGRTITVRADAAADGTVDRNRTRLLTVAPSAAAGLAQLKAGSEVLLTLSGDTVVGIKMSAGGGGGGSTAATGGRQRPPTARGTTGAASTPSTTVPPARGVIVVSPAPPAAEGTQSEIPQLPPGATSPTSRGVPQLPAGANPPQARPVPQVAPSGGVIVITGSPSPGISPTTGAPTRPAVSPVAVGSPRSPGTPRPVVLPSDPPPTPIPSPSP